MDSVLKGRWR